MPDKDINFKHKAFCHEYIVDFCGKDAVIRAGYAVRNPTEKACHLLKDPGVQKLLIRLMRKREIRTEITQDRVLEEYAKIAFFDIRKIYDDFGDLKHVQDLDDDTAAALIGVDVNMVSKDIGTKKIKMADKKAALDSVARHLGMFNDNLNIGGQPDNPIKTETNVDWSKLTLAEKLAVKNATTTDSE